MNERDAYLGELERLLETEERAVLLKLTGEPEDVEFQGETATYTINIINQTCTCPDFLVARAAFPVGHMRRICKHLAHLMKINAETNTFEQVVLREIRFGLAPDDRYRFMGLKDGRIVLMFKHTDRDWCDVIAPIRKANTYDVFGYSVLQKRWSYSHSPRDAMEIKPVLLQWLEALMILRNNT
jgi:hypothetical protein